MHGFSSVWVCIYAAAFLGTWLAGVNIKNLLAQEPASSGPTSVELSPGASPEASPIASESSLDSSRRSSLTSNASERGSDLPAGESSICKALFGEEGAQKPEEKTVADEETPNAQPVAKGKGPGKGPPAKGAGKGPGKGPSGKGPGKGPPAKGAGKGPGKGPPPPPGKGKGKGKAPPPPAKGGAKGAAKAAATPPRFVGETPLGRRLHWAGAHYDTPSENSVFHGLTSDVRFDPELLKAGHRDRSYRGVDRRMEPVRACSLRGHALRQHGACGEDLAVWQALSLVINVQAKMSERSLKLCVLQARRVLALPVQAQVHHQESRSSPDVRGHPASNLFSRFARHYAAGRLEGTEPGHRHEQDEGLIWQACLLKPSAENGGLSFESFR